MSNAIEIHQLHYRAGRTLEIKDLDLSVLPGARRPRPRPPAGRPAGPDPAGPRCVPSPLLYCVSQRRGRVSTSSHLTHQPERFCDWIGLMDNGRLSTAVPLERFKTGVKRL